MIWPISWSKRFRSLVSEDKTSDRSWEEIYLPLDTLREGGRELESAMKDVERSFLDIGDSLEKITTYSGELVQSSERLLEFALGSNGEDLIKHVANHVWRVVDFLQKSDMEREALLEKLRSSENMIQIMIDAERSLISTLAPLGYVQTMFRITSAQLSHDARDMFHALVIEIDRIRLHVEGAFREKFDQVREIRKCLGEAVQLLTRGQRSERSKLKQLHEELRVSLGRMYEIDQTNKHRDCRLTEVSKSVREQTGRVVISLQF